MLLSGFQRTLHQNQESINGHLNRAESSLTNKQVEQLISDILTHLPLALQADKVMIPQPSQAFLQVCGSEEPSVNQSLTAMTNKPRPFI